MQARRGSPPVATSRGPNRDPLSGRASTGTHRRPAHSADQDPGADVGNSVVGGEPCCPQHCRSSGQSGSGSFYSLEQCEDPQGDDRRKDQLGDVNNHPTLIGPRLSTKSDVSVATTTPVMQTAARTTAAIVEVRSIVFVVRFKFNGCSSSRLRSRSGARLGDDGRVLGPLGETVIATNACH